MAKKAAQFEDHLTELEQLVERMEQGNLPLDQTLQLFERGVHLTRICQNSLKDAEQKVRILLEENGKPDLKPFSNDAE